jgi:hypothetical protein
VSNGVSSSTASLLSQTSLIASSPYTATKNPYTGKVQYTYNVSAPVSIDSSTLLAALSANTTTTPSATSAAASNAANATAPTSPWSSTSNAPKQSALVTSVTNGAAFFDPSAAQLDAPAGTNTQDYKALFALYQGLNAMEGLATAASATGVSSAQQAAYQATFAKGTSQLTDYLNSTAFKNIDVASGAIAAKQQTTTGATQETDTYTSKPLVTGSANTPVDAWSGAVAFSMSLKSLNGTSKTVNFDLSEMGDTPRTMGNVVTYLNSKLSVAGVYTRFGDTMTAGTAQTVTVNGTAQTVSTTADTYSLVIKGSPLENLTLTPATSTAAVYLTSTQGAPGKTTTAVTPSTTGAGSTVTTTTGPSDVASIITKLDGGSDAVATSASDGVVSNTTVANSPTAVRATATGPDGSLYVLADIAGTTDDKQALNGTSDVALMKYDSAGNLLYTRTLGAANAANGYAIAVSPDGTQVAVAGTTTGPLDTSDSSQAADTTSGFLSVFSSAGEEQWTQTRASSATDTPTAVTFGSNGQVFVAGTTQGAIIGGGGQVGGQDSYIEGFTGKQVTAANGTKSWVSSVGFNQQFGTTGTDTPSGVAVSGNSLYVAGTENGHAVVRQYALQSSGAPTLTATQDLGDLQGGEVAGISVAADGSLIVAGATHNGALSGTVGQAYGSGKEGFVATLGSNLTPNKVNYVAAPSDFSATSMTVSNGQVYLAGKLAQSPATGQTTGSAAYVAQVDPASGAVGWSRTLQGRDGIDAPTSVAVAQGGTSSLDALGLPSGTISWAKSTTIVGNSSVRAGDQFTIKAGDGLAQTITIQPDDTYVSLAAEINRVTGYQATATTTTVNGKSVLQIVAANARNPVTIAAGPTGKNALTALGLTAGEITPDATLGNVSPYGAAEGKGSNAKSVLGLVLPATMDISTTAGAKSALTALQLAIAKVENLYQDMSTPSKSATSSNQQALSATLSNYYSSQLSNYQLALSRLGG